MVAITDGFSCRTRCAQVTQFCEYFSEKRCKEVGQDVVKR
jgi:hypothetical protein